MSKEINIQGPSLFKWQRDTYSSILNSPKGTKHIISCGRQRGKSILIETVILKYALSWNGTTSIYVAPTQNQSRKLFKDLVKLLDGTGLMKTCNASLLELSFINGSEILFKSAEQGDALRCFTTSGILCIDEAAFISDEVFDILSPTCNVHKAKILICSTPKFKSGFFWRYFSAGEQGVSKVFSYDWSKYDTSALLPPDVLEEYRRMMPKNQFISDYLGQFLDSDGSVFSGFKDCTVPYEELEDYKKVWVGIDWGSGNGQDYTSLSMINERGEQVMCEYFNNLSTTQQIERIATILQPYISKVQCIIPELNSIGTPMTELLKQRLPGVNIKGETTTNDSKTDMVNALQVAFEQKLITLLPDELQQKELSAYEATLNTRTKTISYNAPQGLHDDCCISLMYSWKAFKQGRVTGNYDIGFNRRPSLYKSRLR